MRPVRLTLAGLALPGVRRAGRIFFAEVRDGRRRRSEVGAAGEAGDDPAAVHARREGHRRRGADRRGGVRDVRALPEHPDLRRGRTPDARRARAARAAVLRADPDWKTWTKDEPMVCACGWETTWGEYHKTYKGKQLLGGNAYPHVPRVHRPLAACRARRATRCSPSTRLIHACHGRAQERYARPAACNLIEGRMSELIPFLDELAYGPQSSPGVQEQRRTWDERPQLQAWRRWKAGDAPADDPWGLNEQA